MVAAAAPSPAPARRGLPTAPRRAGPERPPWGGDGVGPGRQGLCGRRDAGGGGRGREAGAPWSRRPLPQGARVSLFGRPDRPAGLAGAETGRRGRPALGALCCGAPRAGRRLGGSESGGSGQG